MRALNRLIGRKVFDVAKSLERCPRGCKKLVTNGRKGKQKRKAYKEWKGETAILYNTFSMKLEKTGVFINRWDPFNSEGERLLCSPRVRASETTGIDSYFDIDLDGQVDPEFDADQNGIVDADLDGDGMSDCTRALQKKQVWAGLSEKTAAGDSEPVPPPARVGVASVHFLLDSDFTSQARADDVPEDFKAQWSREMAEGLVSELQELDPTMFFIGGDFNQSRCPRKDEPGVNPEDLENDPIKERSQLNSDGPTCSHPSDRPNGDRHPLGAGPESA